MPSQNQTSQEEASNPPPRFVTTRPLTHEVGRGGPTLERGVGAARNTKRTARESKVPVHGETFDLDQDRLLAEFEHNRGDNVLFSDDERLDDIIDEDLDIFDMARAYHDDGRDAPIAEVTSAVTGYGILDGQKSDNFCQTVLAQQSRKTDSAFFEGSDGIV